ncbi:MAG: transcriptional regulator [Luteolibacter sp.]
MKPRPVLLLRQMPPFYDYLVCALSSKLHHECPGFDEVITFSDDEFPDSGSKVASLIRLGMRTTLSHSAILGKLGTVSEARLNRMRIRLARCIQAE